MSEELQDGQDRQRLLDELDRLRFLLDVSPQVRWTGNAEGEITWVSEQWVAITGHPREAALGLGWVEFLHPDDVSANDQQVRHAIETKSSYDMEYRVRHADDTYRWMRGRAVPRTDDKGETLWYGMTEDIHDRKAAESEVARALQSLQVTQESLSLAMKGGRMGWWTRDLRTDAVVWSPELETIFGYPPHGFTGTRRDFLSHVHPDDLPDFKASVEKALASKTEYAVVFRFRRADGREGWMEGRGLAVYDSEGCPIASYGVGIDITEQRRMQEASAGQYRQVAEGLPQLVWSALPNGERDYYNQRWFDYTGPMPGLSVSELWSNTVHPDDRARALQRWQQSVRTGESFQAEYRLRRNDGEYRWYLGRALPIRDDEGKIVRWFGTCTDIHDQKLAEHALAVSNEFAKTLSADLDLDRIVQALTDACTQAIGAQFGSFFYSVVNEEGEALLLYTLSGAPIEAFEKFGLPRPTKVFGPTFRNEGIVRSADITKDPRYGSMGPHFGMPKGHLPVVSYLAISVVSRSGEVIGGLFFGHSKPGVFTEEHERIVSSFAAQAAVAIDNARLYASVTSMKETLERQVTERTADLQNSNDALQGFTYHVAHDLRSPLRTIVSTSRILQEDFGDHLPTEAAELLDRQALAAGRLGRLIDDLLRMARLTREEARRDRVDITQMGHEVAVEALEAHPQSQVAVEVQDGLVADADPRLFRLALGNLVENAVKYSPSGGTVRLGRREDGAFFVSDEGIGIDPRYFAKVFEPFQRLHRDDEFSGTGIGLSNVQQIIARHGGRVWVESELGKGSTFFFTLE
jgi:PAS domain S-box-containing protein